MKLFKSVFLIFIAVSSCTQEAKKHHNQPIPSYSNIDFDSIFTPKDHLLPNEENIKNQLDTYYYHLWEQSNLWGGILVAKGDKILLEKYRGYSQEHQKEHITKDTPLHIASVSKPITAMAILKLVEAGKITLDTPVTQFFPKFPYPKVTIKTLLNHRSGLPKYEHFIDKLPKNTPELSKPYLSNLHILDLLTKHKPNVAREHNTGFMYCNTNYALLALIIEKVTQESFPVAMQKMIFSPLGMKNTYIFQKKHLSKAARSFYDRASRVYPYDRLDLIYGDKNVYTTPSDLYRFSKAMFSPHFLRQDLKALIFKPYSNEKAGINNYGLGFRMKIFENGGKLTYHNGWWQGSNSVFVHLPNSKTTIIALGNKYSRKIYSAMALSSLFEDFPYDLQKIIHPNGEGEENLE